MHDSTVLFVLLGVGLLCLAGGFFVVPLWVTGHHLEADPPQRTLAIGLLVLLVLLVSVLYLHLGTVDGLASGGTSPTPIGAAKDAKAMPDQSAGTPTPEQIESMVNRLAQRLQDQPNDPAGWRMLARSHETLGRFEEAVKAYERLLALQAPDPDLLTEYAVTLGMTKGQTLVGEPEAVIAQALKLNPSHIQALALSGSAAFEGRRYQQAIQQWQHLLSLVPADAPMRATIEAHMAKARALAVRDGMAGASRASP